MNIRDYKFVSIKNLFKIKYNIPHVLLPFEQFITIVTRINKDTITFKHFKKVENGILIGLYV